MTPPSDPSACDSAAKKHIESIEDDRVYLYVAARTDSFKAGWSECEKVMGQRIDELQASHLMANARIKELEWINTESQKTIDSLMAINVAELESKLEVAIKLANDLIESHEGVYHQDFWESEMGKRAKEALAQLTKESK